MKKIKKLTQAQIDRFPEFVEKWTEIGLCTEPADRLGAAKNIRLAYEIAERSHPEKIVWTTSPLAHALTIASVLSMGTYDKASVRESVLHSVRESVWASVRKPVWESVVDSVRGSGAGPFGRTDDHRKSSWADACRESGGGWGARPAGVESLTKGGAYGQEKDFNSRR